MTSLSLSTSDGADGADGVGRQQQRGAHETQSESDPRCERIAAGRDDGVPVAQAQAGPESGKGAGADAVKVFDAQVTQEQIPLLLAAGQDAHELGEAATGKSAAKVELFLTDAQARDLERQGVDVTERKVAAKASARMMAAGDGVYRPYSGDGNLKEEIVETGQANPGLTKVVSIGKTVKGQDILALKLTKGAKKSADGSKPAVLYMSNQHAREWITPEMTRRLMHYYIDNYGKDQRITKLVDSTEMWFVLSANPDGYDYTFSPDGDRLWRKNLRDVNGDGQITPGDGVDLNRNFGYKWGYDDEGSSPRSTSETYRGAAPNSEPETQAIDTFEKRIGFEYGINYHSAAELLLYGVGWQVATPTPDDVLYQSLAGTPENSAVPGYYPQVSSELYTTNGEADGHASNVNGIMMFTPEMTTCQDASAIDPNDAWEARDCQSGFNYPDDEKLIQAEFAKNVPFALSVAETASHPDQPSSSVGLTAPDFTLDPFTTSYARGTGQEVAVTARKSVKDKEVKYRINGGRTWNKTLKPWQGGETYGGEDNLYFDEYRAKVEEVDPGDKVEVWFTGRTKAGKATASEHFTYTVAQRAKADTLVVAEEGAPAQQAQAYVDALKANGRKAVVWDVATQGAPHPLGILSHFTTVVHYTGAVAPGGETQLAVRDFINEGGKLIEAGELAGGNAQVGRAATNDFSQYYLGAYGRSSAAGATGFAGAGALAGVTGPLGAALGNPLNQAGNYTVTSDTLSPADYPQFKSAAAGTYSNIVNPYAPYAGQWMAAASHEDSDWRRLTRTVDLTGVTAAQTAATADGAQLEHRARVRPRGPGGPHHGRRRLDHAARRGRCDQHRGARRVRGRVLHAGPPVPRPLPDPRERRLHRDRHQRRVEQLHRFLERLEAGLLRPERLRGQDGRGVAELHHRPGHRRTRRLRRRRPAGRGRHGAGGRGLRDLARRLDHPGIARRAAPMCPATGRAPRSSSRPPPRSPPRTPCCSASVWSTCRERQPARTFSARR